MIINKFNLTFIIGKDAYSHHVQMGFIFLWTKFLWLKNIMIELGLD